MAKKEREFQYGSAFLPEGEKKYSVMRWGWNGLNREDDIDTGQLTDMEGMLCDPPYMLPVKAAKLAIDLSDGIPTIDPPGAGMAPVSGASAVLHRGIPISITGDMYSSTGTRFFTLIWLDQDKNKIMATRYYYTGTSALIPPGWYCTVSYELGDGGLADTSIPRTVLLFNAVDTSSGNIAAYTYDRKQLIYPDCYSIPAGLAAAPVAKFNTTANPIPYPKIATVYGSRVFSVNNDDLISASAYNSYVDYSLDTADDISSAHAWASMAGSNTNALGSVTALVTYDNHVIIFRRDFMQLVYNNKNPFRIVDVGKYGCVSNKAWTILNGVLYFASYDKVYAYTGGTPKEISAKLDVTNFAGAVLGSFGDKVWMQTGDSLYVYQNGVWSDVGLVPFQGEDMTVMQFASTDRYLAALTSSESGYAVYIMDWDEKVMDPNGSFPYWDDEYPSEWYFITDLMALNRLDIRRVKKFSMLCEGREGAEVSVYLLKDGEKFSDLPEEERAERKVGTLTLEDDGFHRLRVLTRQFSASMHQLCFRGRGYMKIYAAELKIAWGGDLYVES